MPSLNYTSGCRPRSNWWFMLELPHHLVALHPRASRFPGDPQGPWQAFDYSAVLKETVSRQWSNWKLPIPHVFVSADDGRLICLFLVTHPVSSAALMELKDRDLSPLILVHPSPVTRVESREIKDNFWLKVQEGGDYHFVEQKLCEYWYICLWISLLDFRKCETGQGWWLLKRTSTDRQLLM